MGKLWMQAKANIRRTKSVSVTLTVMFLISALLLNAGLLVAVNYGAHFGNLKQELQAADAYLAIPDALYSDRVQSYIDSNEHVKKTQTHQVLWINGRIDSQKGKERSYTVLFQNMDESREISKWKYIGEHQSPGEMSVYVPDIFKAVGGYELGDKLTLRYTEEGASGEKELSFTVKGYTEDVFFSSTDTGMMSFYLPQDTYKQVSKILGNPVYGMHLVYTNLDEVSNSSKVESGLREFLGLSSASLVSGDVSTKIVSIDIELIEMARCMMATMMAAMMVMFALVVVAVCLLVVRYRIVNSIQDDMMKIGSLKAIGYTGRQIRLSQMLQYLLIAGVGSVLGIALTYPALPAVASVFEQQSGLKWEQGFDPVISAAALFIILLIVLLLVALATRRIKKLSPISALRGESSQKRVRHNRLPLEKARGPLPFALGVKATLQNLKLSIVFIMAAVTFVGCFGIVMFYNTTVDTKAFAEVPGMEITNVIATLNPQQDQSQTVREIRAMPQVRKAVYFDTVNVRVGGTDVSAYVMDNFDDRETHLVYDGRNPEKSGEIVLAGILADRLQKKTGDTVTVSFGKKEETFTVVGLSNGSNMGGLNTCLLREDYERLNPIYKQQSLYVYLNEGESSAGFIETLKQTYDGQTLLDASDFDKLLEEGMASYQNIVAVMGIAMLVITLAVVALVLYFMVSSSVIRQKRELGIQKAIGFTTFQLMNQLSLTFMIPVTLGAAAGSVLGAFLTNPMMSVAMKGAGVMKANFIVDPVWIVLFCLATVVFSWALSMLTTWRIRKISAYALVTE